ncbi:hypothetical protein GKE82_03700 [Conexibacter sp. W3-3-2]|uniref:hypothetical protein n=1 Tax=Conexibacter sp. W3-3-2 TaxID=2675227 RepID=UPI0012B72537|nr:hypothetical protein [Conexibacter sp. W3-3-2]MTD43429.1 hypothetical protein [Conexibacter sp. W3-3-2]
MLAPSGTGRRLWAAGVLGMTPAAPHPTSNHDPKEDRHMTADPTPTLGVIGKERLREETADVEQLIAADYDAVTFFAWLREDPTPDRDAHRRAWLARHPDHARRLEA